MNPNDRKTIQSNIDSLAEKLVLDNKLIAPMVNKNIFTQNMMDDIMRISNETDRKKRFLFDLCRRGPEAFDAFVEVLYGLNQISAAKVLRPTYFANAMNSVKIVEQITLSQPESTSGPNPGLDDGDSVRTRGTVATLETDKYMITVQKSKKAMEGENIYRMTSDPRGFCLVFNIHQFKNNAYPERLGSEAEANALRDVFTQLHFEVKVFVNSTEEDMRNKLSEYSQNPILRSHNALIVLVLSHGHSGLVVCSDNISVGFEDIIKYFNNKNCSHLIRKPKLFFFSCCRGDNRDSGVHFSPEVEEAVPDAKPIGGLKKAVIPVANDMLICYSTVDGYVSWRNEERGTWFGTALCQAIMKLAHKEDLHHILTVTSNALNNKQTKDGEKQVMEHTFRGFTKLFYFNPGITFSATNGH